VATQDGGPARPRPALLGRVPIALLLLTALAVAGRVPGWQRDGREDASRAGQAATATAPTRGAGSPAGPAPDPTKPLRGVPLTERTGLRLLIADNPPILLDVDTGSTQRITGVPRDRDQVVWLQAVGEHAVIMVDQVCLDCAPDASVPPRAKAFLLRRDSTAAIPIGPAWSVAPARGGQAMWMLNYADATHCTLRQVGLDGRRLRAPRPIGCVDLLQDTPAGLLTAARPPGSEGVVRYALLDPASGRVIRRFPNQVHAMIGRLVLGATAPHETHQSAANDARRVPFVLTSLTGAARYELGWPSELPWTDEVRMAPDGRLVAVAFGSPAEEVGQEFDVWVLDTGIRRWRHLPDMPADVALKATSMAWAANGRLVLLAADYGVRPDDAGSFVVGVWRPGQARIAVRPVELPVRTGGSDGFVVW
jgi:hypothetical protein